MGYLLDSKRIGDKIKAIRGELSRADYARLIGVSGSSVAMYESGRRIPRDEIKLAIANAAKKSVEEIFFT